jgi:hypothetical protein
MATYHNQGHGHRVSVSGKVLPLTGPIYHDDRKPLARWLASQQRYARIEADYLMRSSPASLHLADRIRLMGWAAPFAVLVYTLFIKRCLFDGWPGWFYALQRMLAEVVLALEIIDRRFGGNQQESALRGKGV